MAKEKFNIIQSTCIPIEIDNNNTDNIIPARYLAFTTRDPKFYGDAFMHDTFLDKTDLSGKKIVPFCTFGSGGLESSVKDLKEKQPHAEILSGYGVRVVISNSFADIHRNNLLNCFVLPVIVSRKFQLELFKSIAEDSNTLVTVDVPNQTVKNEKTGSVEHFEINSYKKYCLLNAYDDIDFLLANTDKIEAWEKKK